MLLCLLPLYPFLGNSVGANHNKDDKSCVNNYIPISLLCCVEKVFERLIFKRQFSFRQENNVLTSFQSGFIPGDSSVSNLTCLYNVFCKVLDDGLEVRSVFFDISKAFDRVWHKGLLHKLKSTGVSGELLLWFKNYLTDRQQRVVLPGASSQWKVLSSGVPQGSILGPLLFLIFINDIVSDIGSNIRLFADDTSMYLVVENPNIAAATININRVSNRVR